MTTPKKITLRLKRHHRIRSKVQGTAERPRLAVSRSLNHHYAQLINDVDKKTLVGVSDYGKNNKITGPKIKRAKKIGLEIAKLATAKGITACVFDRAGYRYHGRVKAIADGAREGGLKF